MPQHIEYSEFRDDNVRSLYPFGDTATLTSTDGLVSIDRDLFVDASLYPIGGAVGLYITSILVANRAVTIYVGNVRTPTLCSATFDPLLPGEVLAFSDAYGRPAGILLFDPVIAATAQSWPSGKHAFATTATPFAASCTIPVPGVGVRGVLAGGVLHTGTVWIVGDGGVVVTGDGAQGIRFDVVGDPLFVRKLCAPEGLFDTPRFVKTINGMPPDEYGNFQINVGSADADDTILRVYASGDGEITIEAVGKQIGT